MTTTTRRKASSKKKSPKSQKSVKHPALSLDAVRDAVHDALREKLNPIHDKLNVLQESVTQLRLSAMTPEELHEEQTKIAAEIARRTVAQTPTPDVPDGLIVTSASNGQDTQDAPAQFE